MSTVLYYCIPFHDAESMIAGYQRKMKWRNINRTAFHCRSWRKL